MRIFLFTLLLMASVAAHASEPESQAVVKDLQLIYIFEGKSPEYLFVIGQSGFKSVETLKEHLKTWPSGSELRWAPGCVVLGGEPLLSSAKEMEAFKEFLQGLGITFTLLPSG